MRAALIDGDLRLFYLLWLRALETDALTDDTLEPLAGIGPLTASLQAFADFIRIDPDLLEAAAENEAAGLAEPSARFVEKAIADLPDGAKVTLLIRLFNADPHVGAELRRQVQPRDAVSPPSLTTVGALRARAAALRLERARAKAEAAAALRKREAHEAERHRRLHLDALARRGDAVWREIEAEIDRRNASGYGKAATLLTDLRTLAVERDLTAEFDRRLTAIREQHAQKNRFIER